MFEANLKLDGISIVIGLDETNIFITFDGEHRYFSCVNAQLIATTLYAAIAEIENGDKT
jgi:hypothetical protein